MKSRNSQRIKIADKEEVQVKAANNQAGILIVSDHLIVRQGLMANCSPLSDAISMAYGKQILKLK